MVSYELLVGHPPFFDRDFSKMCTKIMTRPLKFPNMPAPETSSSSLSSSLFTGTSPQNNQDIASSVSSSKSFIPKHVVSQIAQSFVQNLLQRDHKQRLCCGQSPEVPNYGIVSLQRHPFFADVDWYLLSDNDPLQDGNNYILPPYVPNFGKDPEDVRNFDREFTKLTVKDSISDNDRGLVSVSPLTIPSYMIR